MTDDDSALFFCHCGCCALKVEAPFPKLSDWLSLTLWKQEQCHRFNPCSRWTQIWEILRHGSPYVGEVLLTRAVAMALGETLVRYGKEVETEP